MQVDPRRLCQIEIPVHDLHQAQSFYAAAFGWHAVPAELHRYVVLAVPDDCPYGISLVPQSSTIGGRGPVLYFGVDAPETNVAAVERAGGKSRGGPVTLPGYGAMYLVEDPDGNRFGFYLKAGR
jgi:predicted enzyme related to lactoylglutathione lyase